MQSHIGSLTACSIVSSGSGAHTNELSLNPPPKKSTKSMHRLVSCWHSHTRRRAKIQIPSASHQPAETRGVRLLPRPSLHGSSPLNPHKIGWCSSRRSRPLSIHPLACSLLFLPSPSLARRQEDVLVGGDAGRAGPGGAVPEQGGGSGQDLQGHPVRLQVHQQRPARHHAERRQVHHLGPQGLPTPQVGERSARSHKPARQRDPSHTRLAWEVQECAAVDLLVPGPVRVDRKIGDLPEQGAHGPHRQDIPLLLDDFLCLCKSSRAWRAQEAIEGDEEARQGAQGRRQIRGRAVPGEDEAVGRPAAGAGEGGHGRGGGRGAAAAGAQQGHPPGHRGLRLRHLPHLLLSATPVSRSPGQTEGMSSREERYSLPPLKWSRCCARAWNPRCFITVYVAV